MELEEMRAEWNKLSTKVEKQEKLTEEVIEKLVKYKYRTGLKRISIPEYVGTLICYVAAAWLIINFGKLDGGIYQFFGAVIILLLFTLPVISLKSVTGMNRLRIATGTYAETIRDFAKQKIRFQKLQKINVSLALGLFVISLPVLANIQGKDINAIPNFWVFFPMSILLILMFSWWVLSNYNNALREAEEMLKELDH